MDVIGPISPKVSNGYRFIFVVINYFTRWVEVTSYANVTKSTISKFLKKEIICRYKMPERIISDNALNLNNNKITEVCSQFKIKHHNSSLYRLKMNGAVEATYKNIKKVVGKMTDTYKDWHEKLPFAIYAYRTSVRTSTGATPFSLVYGMVILSEICQNEVKWIQSRYGQLNLIEEKKLKAIRHAYDKKVRPREFHEGDLVLKNIILIQKDFIGKWMPNSEGPYVVKQAFSGEALILIEMDGKNLPNPVNSDLIPVEQEGMIKDTTCKSYLPKVAVEQIEDSKSYLPEVIVEQIEDSESYLSEVAVEQIKATNLISLKLQWNRLKLQTYIPKVAVEQIEATNLIALKLQWDKLKLSW
ncbi:RNA-directed DNA polymerase (Reverse transcriptase), Ribonuclease H [Gossypium australe]|uniref:RNA-directed DNA polymerase (Reverse transcriptase), Ribonuclease H n=1 Tax=Gossypium australe TaxID=47621 RepID=A0A5B6WNJ8_9ROSI|nr:RNA-directed DNA polymerase (Reverse transcriptase), Ribonuclease H [Gossypium australe]